MLYNYNYFAVSKFQSWRWESFGKLCRIVEKAGRPEGPVRGKNQKEVRQRACLKHRKETAPRKKII